MIYEDCGWDIGKNYNPLGEVYPTIEQLYAKIPNVVSDMGYDLREQKNISGALLARINSLRIGTKGNCLNVKESLPLESILSRNAVVELEDIGDEETKAFLMSLLLVQVMEYRMGEADAQKKLRHLILIEEAHRLLKNISSGTVENADPRGNAVEMFCNMLAELRSKGQGFIIADQIPSKLAPDAIKNTNLKIIHRIVAEEDRNLVGKSTHMNEAQIEHLSTLKQGVGAVYSEGDYIPKIVKGNYVGDKEIFERKHLNHSDIQKLCASNEETVQYENQARINRVCALCPLNCSGERTKNILAWAGKEVLDKALMDLKNHCDADTLSATVNAILSDMLQQIGTDRLYWTYSFCILKWLSEEMELSKSARERMYYDIQANITCLSDAPSIWKERRSNG